MDNICFIAVLILVFLVFLISRADLSNGGEVILKISLDELFFRLKKESKNEKRDGLQPTLLRRIKRNK